MVGDLLLGLSPERVEHKMVETFRTKNIKAFQKFINNSR